MMFASYTTAAKVKQYQSSSLTDNPGFAECALGRTVSATWICRDQRLGMNSCMVAHATRAEEDGARAEWFSGREERRKKREEEAAGVERRREEVIVMIKREEEKETITKARASDAKTTEERNKGWWR